ncbi:hypothetical protein niasHT_024482 [Heterodera trifolii]|uniref:Uncharacterized protein n=1 Tax=Heterodera trifolii TaxID=157864 RepID=A0ABD2K7A4_9BILA
MSNPLSFSFLCRKCLLRPVHFHSQQKHGISSLLKGNADNFVVVMSNSYLAEGFTETFKFLSSVSLLGPSSSVLLLAVGLRLATVPVRILNEKLTSQRLMMVHLVRKQVYEKIGAHYGIATAFDAGNGKWTLNTHDSLIQKSADELSDENVKRQVSDQKLTMSRLVMLRYCLVPIWIQCNFGILRYVEGLFGQQIPGFLWIDSLTLADPFMVFPICMGALALTNVWANRWMFMSTSSNYKVLAACFDVALVAVIIGSVKMLSDSPVIFSLYWCCVLTTGLLETLLLRSPKVKRLFSIGPLPDDAEKPFRSLFRRRIYVPYSMH